MNQVQLLGRLTKDIELKYTASQKSVAVAKFSLAVNRKYKRDGEPTADFINCTAFGKTAETLDKFCKKGSQLIVFGHIQTGSYEKDGHKVFTTDVMVDGIEFVANSSKSEASDEPVANTMPSADGFFSIPDGIADTLPFA